MPRSFDNIKLGLEKISPLENNAAPGKSRSWDSDLAPSTPLGSHQMKTQNSACIDRLEAVAKGGELPP